MRYLVPILLLTLSACNADKGCADRRERPADGRPSTTRGNQEWGCDLADEAEGNAAVVTVGQKK